MEVIAQGCQYRVMGNDINCILFRNGFDLTGAMQQGVKPQKHINAIVDILNF